MRSWSFCSTLKADTLSRRNSEYRHSPPSCHGNVGSCFQTSKYPRERHGTEPCHDRDIHLGPGPPQSPVNQFALEVRSLPKRSGTKSRMARGIQLPLPNEHQTQPGLGLPFDETISSRKRRQTVSQFVVHPTNDTSLSTRSLQTNESTHTSWSGEDEDRKHEQAMVAHKVAERNRRLEQDAKKKVIERLLPESSLDKKNNRWGNTKAGILEGAILVLDGLPMETKVEAVKNTLTKKDRAALAHECAETRAGRRCLGECGLVQLISMNTPPPSNYSSPGDKRLAPPLTADERLRLTNPSSHLRMAPLAPVHYQ